MAIAAIFNVAGMTAQQYDAVIESLDRQGFGAPAGRLHHTAAATETGWCVMDVWNSEAEFGGFGEKLVPALIAVGLTPPQPQVYPVHKIIQG